jgi:hypothetical protein
MVVTTIRVRSAAPGLDLSRLPDNNLPTRFPGLKRAAGQEASSSGDNET